MTRPVTARERLLEAVVRGAVPVLRAIARSDDKLGRGVRARLGATDHLLEWQRTRRDPARPLVWVHAPSVGEALMAKAIIAALRIRRPDVLVAFTCFSPSAERVAATVGADVTGYLPWDSRAHTGRVVDELRPAVVACVRTEVWPLLARSTSEAGGAVALVNAVLSDRSGRARPLARWLLAPTHARLDAVGVVAARDEARFRRMGVPPERIRLTGDARFDQVWQRVELLRADAARLRRMRALVPPGRPVIVAGSTWPADERVLARAAQRLASLTPAPVWIIAPHEPSDAHLGALERTLDAVGVSSIRLAAAERAGAAVQRGALLVDRVGVLADLYAIAEVAYVGGGFHDQGLHSVVEPAALGVPVIFGPRHGNAGEAAELAATAGGRQVDGADALAEALRSLLTDAAVRAGAADAARRFVQDRLGGADRNAALIDELIETSGRRSGTR